MHCRRTGDEMIQPSARFIRQRPPEITASPVARRVTTEKSHVHAVIRHIGMRNALLGIDQMIEMIVIDDHGALGAQQLDTIRLA